MRLELKSDSEAFRGRASPLSSIPRTSMRLGVTVFVVNFRLTVFINSLSAWATCPARGRRLRLLLIYRCQDRRSEKSSGGFRSAIYQIES